MPGLSKDYYKHLPMPLRTSRSHFGSLLLGRFSDWFDLIGLFSEAHPIAPLYVFARCSASIVELLVNVISKLQQGRKMHS